MDPIPGITEVADEGIQGAFYLDDARRAAVLDRLQEWVAEHGYAVDETNPESVRRRLAQVEQFTGRLNRLCRPGGFSLSLDLRLGRLVLTPGGGDTESTLILLRRGTNWFEGCHELEVLVVSAIF